MAVMEGIAGNFLSPEKIVNEFDLSEGMSVADFGSGSGHLTIISAQKVGKEGKVYAFDILEDKLDSVRVRAKAASLENVEAVRANLEILGGSGLPDQSIDFVILANILFQSQKKTDIFREVKRVLKPRGRVALIDWKRGSGGFGPPDDIRTDTEEMKSLIGEAGFVFEKNIDAGQFHYGFILKA